MAYAFRFRRIVPLVVLLALPTTVLANWWHESSNHRGRKYQAPPPDARITVTVMSEQFHKPVNDASVIFHSTRDNRPDGFMEIPTNRHGVAVITVIPVGDTLELQVLGRNYQSFGQYYKIDSATKNIRVDLLPPKPQFSDYHQLPTGQVGDGGKGTTQPQPGNSSHSSDKQN